MFELVHFRKDAKSFVSRNEAETFAELCTQVDNSKAFDVIDAVPSWLNPKDKTYLVAALAPDSTLCLGFCREVNS